MCSRFANEIDDFGEWAEFFSDFPDDTETGYNIAPSLKIPVLTQSGMASMRWGLIPSWSKDNKLKFSTFNARIESIDSKPAFRSAWEQANTCLIPVLGYYEWKDEDHGKQPYFVRAKQPSPLVFAGIYESELKNHPASCTIITKPADNSMEKLHQRIPIMPSIDLAADWLAGNTSLAHQMIRPNLKVYAVDQKINKVGAGDKSFITAI